MAFWIKCPQQRLLTSCKEIYILIIWLQAWCSQGENRTILLWGSPQDTYAQVHETLCLWCDDGGGGFSFARECEVSISIAVLVPTGLWALWKHLGFLHTITIGCIMVMKAFLLYLTCSSGIFAYVHMLCEILVCRESGTSRSWTGFFLFFVYNCKGRTSCLPFFLTFLILPRGWNNRVVRRQGIPSETVWGLSPEEAVLTS